MGTVNEPAPFNQYSINALEVWLQNELQYTRSNKI